jgi:peptidoglycan hydrolase-like protein with peptidoglycan-binding domain
VCGANQQGTFLKLWLATTDTMCKALGPPTQPSANARDIHFNDEGPDVVFVQYHVNRIGYSVAEGGVFGPLTQKAFAQFQQCVHYPNSVPGVVNKEARQALLAALSHRCG